MQDLWLQQATRSGRVKIWKVAGVLNDADLGTKPLGREAIDTIVKRMGGEFVHDR